jgi:uncharacterized membrane protein
MNVKTFLAKEQQQSIVEAIVEAEKCTSGEIRVHIENACKDDVLDRAAHIFEKLGMHKTALRNGVLIYISMTDRKLAILGDAGINSKVPADFWEDIKNDMIGKFSQNLFTEGLCEGVLKVGTHLKAYFPIESDDTNELPNEISFGA